MTLREDSDWMQMGECIGQSMVYPTLGAHIQRLTDEDLLLEERAVATCLKCRVISQCRDWALQEPDPAFDHVAGGLTPKQRWAIRKAQR